METKQTNNELKPSVAVNNNEQKIVKKEDSIATFLQKPEIKEKFKQILPKHCSIERLYRITYQAMAKNPKLKECTKESIINCLITLSQYGLEPDGRRAHLVPYKNEATVLIDYKGIVDIVIRSGQVRSIHADVVCSNDEFETNMGKVLKHKIHWGQERGEPIAAYCIITLKDGTEKHEIMDWQQIMSIRDRSKSYAYAQDKSQTPWATDTWEMAKKTVFKRAAKWLIWDSDLRDKLEADDELIIDVSEKKEEQRISLYEQLLAKCSDLEISEEQLNQFANQKGIYKGEIINAPEPVLKKLMDIITRTPEIVKGE